ncbi:hypothetical protein [Brumimicrobium sp.]|uniref:hypothetical protein n=1 Tax=Brumimicrobium sp. TaxID=2029867 RepID=UPI003A952DC1
MTTFKIGSSFPFAVAIVGGVISFAGLLLLANLFLVGIVAMAIGAFFWSSTYGLQINDETQEFREYGSVLGLKRGDWKPLDQLPYLTVLKSRKGTTLYSRSNRSTTIINDDYEVVMLNETHRVKVLVQSFEKKEKAMKFAEQFVLAYNKQLVKYNPVVSDATLRRRRR